MANGLISRCATTWALGTALALALGLTPLAAQAQTYTDLHDFANGGPVDFNGSGRLAQGRDGNFYGASLGGGTFESGAVFQLTPSGTLTIIHSLNGATDGASAEGGLTLGVDGNFYGNAAAGGGTGAGTLFKVTPSGTLTVLHNFTNAADSSNPVGVLVLANNGDFYGNTSAQNGSMIYQLTPTGTFTPVYTLPSKDYSVQLSLGSDGNLYGGDSNLTLQNPGTAFKLTPKGVFTPLHHFDVAGGVNPIFGMVQAANGTFYGATGFGGSIGQGTVYSLTSSRTFTLLHTLNGATDGSSPRAQLLLASDGNLYGVAEGGGTHGCGTIFQVTPAGFFSVVHAFENFQGCEPQEQVVQGTDGVLYGIATLGGANGDGAFYSLDLGLPAFAGLVSPAGRPGTALGILGQGFDSSSVVTFGGGVQATSVILEGSTFISAIIPAGAVTGKVTVTTGSTTLTSIENFKVLP